MVVVVVVVVAFGHVLAPDGISVGMHSMPLQFLTD